MATNKKLEKFSKLVSSEPSNFLSKLDYYTSNKKNLDRSSKIAINILEILKDRKWSQKDLAIKMDVSAQYVNKIIKGQVNMTFETIEKIESALEFDLIEIADYKPVENILTKAENVKAIGNSLTEEFVLKRQERKTSEKMVTKMSVVHNVNYAEINNEYPIAM